MKKIAFLFIVINLFTLSIFSQTSNAELAKEAQNPLSNMISIPFQNNTTYRIGDNNSTQNILSFQPVIPFGFEKFKVYTRFIIPIISDPDLAGGDNNTGLGDMNLTAFFSPNNESSVTWGFGPVFQFPTATNSSLGSQEFGIGPAFVITATDEKWVYGLLVHNIWTLDDLRTEKKMLLQPIVNYYLPKAWYLVSSPIWQANWHASDRNQWLMPLGGGLGKVIIIGKMPININAHVYYNVAMQDPNWGRWQSRFQLQFMFPKK